VAGARTDVTGEFLAGLALPLGLSFRLDFGSSLSGRAASQINLCRCLNLCEFIVALPATVLPREDGRVKRFQRPQMLNDDRMQGD
jgi:hypothetical protein